jgi:DNA-directed RNA polymerase specialized sigma subunit
MLAAVANPIFDFLKYAGSTQVRAHTRRTKSKIVPVTQHTRETEEDANKSQDALDNLETLDAKKAREIELWSTWKNNGERPEDLRPLLKSFRPMIRSKVNVYKGKVKMIPDSAIESEFQLRFVDALRSYDPSKGSLGTYVYRYLDKAKRFIVENQNIGRIPENRVYKIKLFNIARDDLTEELGTPPKTEELAERLGWSVAETDRMESELRNDLLSQGFEDDPYALVPSKSEEVLRLFKYELTGNERTVYEYLTGYGKPQTSSTGEIASAMKIPDYQVSRLKNTIKKKLQRYLTE